MPALEKYLRAATKSKSILLTDKEMINTMKVSSFAKRFYVKKTRSITKS